MNKYKLLILLYATLAMLTSCKLDPVVLPPGTIVGPNNGQTVLGITVNGSTINNPYLTRSWKTAYTTQQYYDTAGIVVSGALTTDKFSSVTLNDATKAVSYVGFTSSGTYLLSLNNNVFFIKLPADPFGRSANTPVRITSLTSNEMTWVAIDPFPIVMGGQRVNKAYQVVFMR